MTITAKHIDGALNQWFTPEDLTEMLNDAGFRFKPKNEKTVHLISPNGYAFELFEIQNGKTVLVYDYEEPMYFDSSWEMYKYCTTYIS